MFLVMGANHDYFNTIWTPSDFNLTGDPTPNNASNPNDPFHNNPFPSTASDDWTEFHHGNPSDSFAGYETWSNQRLSAVQERAVGLAYVSAFMQTYLGGSSVYLPMLKGDALPPASTDVAPGTPPEIHTTSLGPDRTGDRFDVNRMDGSPTPGVTVSTTSSGVVLMPLTPGSSIVTADTKEHEPDASNLNRLQIMWTEANAIYQTNLPPADRDLTGFDALEFRAGVNYLDTVLNPVTEPFDLPAQDFSVNLTDGEGQQASVPVSMFSTALYFPPGGFDTSGNPHMR